MTDRETAVADKLLSLIEDAAGQPLQLAIGDYHMFIHACSIRAEIPIPAHPTDT